MIDAGDGSSRFVWTADLLPNDLAAPTGELMERGVEPIRETLEAQAASPR